jgi:hypothetical protein
MRSFSETDPASALAAIGDRPVCFEDVELCRAPKIAQPPADADAESRPSAAQPSILEGMRQPDDVADLHRSYDRRPKPPQMCQLNSISFYAIRKGFPLRRVVKSSPRWKTLRDPRIRVFRWEDWR